MFFIFKGMTSRLVLTDAQKLERFSSKKQNPKQNSIVLGGEKSDVCSRTNNEFSKEPQIENVSGSIDRYLNPTDSKSWTVSQGKSYDELSASERNVTDFYTYQ